jgi:hypothetical protein
MCSPTAMIVIWLPTPAIPLPSHSRANAGLSRNGVRSTKWLRLRVGVGEGAGVIESTFYAAVPQPRNSGA